MVQAFSTALKGERSDYGVGRWLMAYRRTFVVSSLVLMDGFVTFSSVRLAEFAADVVGAPVRHISGLATILMLLACLRFLGLYSGAGPTPFERFRLRTIGSLVTTGTVAIALLPTNNVMGVTVAVAAFAILMIVLGFYIEFVVRHALMWFGIWGAPTVIVGDRVDVERLCDKLLCDQSYGLWPVGVVTPDGGVTLTEWHEGVSVMGDTAAINAPTTEIVVCTSEDVWRRAQPTLMRLPGRFKTLVLKPDLEDGGVWTSTRDLGLGLSREINQQHALMHNRTLKRCLDIAIALPALFLVSPIILISALLIKWIDPGPAIYVQPRLGLNNRTVRIFKLRSMYQDAEKRLDRLLARDTDARTEWERFFKLRNDPRILPVIGRFLRSSSIDELPQLLNVVRGDISLVGPRPLPAYHLESFDPEFQKMRATVPPGLTGLWQVSSRSDGDLAVLKEKDSNYIQKWSIWLDVFLIFKTVLTVLVGRGAR